MNWTISAWILWQAMYIGPVQCPQCTEDGHGVMPQVSLGNPYLCAAGYGCKFAIKFPEPIELSAEPRTGEGS